jgi:hypothetical protein
MHGASDARALLSNLIMHQSLSCVLLNKYYEDSEQIFSAFKGFLCSPIKKYFFMNAIIFECYSLTCSQRPIRLNNLEFVPLLFQGY